MEVSAEAKRIMVVALGKLYSSRTQRGGLRLHRSLLLTLVMKSARDMYHAAATLEEESPDTEEPVEEVREAVTQPEREEAVEEAREAVTQRSRKRRGRVSAVPDFLPLKKAKLDTPHAQLAVLVDYGTCGDLCTGPSPIPVPMAIAAC